MNGRWNRLAVPLLAAAGLSLAALFPAFAETADSTITAIAVDAEGNIILTVSGTGFDPMMRLEKAPGGMYRIVLTGEHVNWAEDNLQAAAKSFNERLGGSIPAIEGARLARRDDGSGVVIVLEAWQKLQPQVRSNTGDRIVIALIGDRSRPPQATQIVPPKTNPEVKKPEPAMSPPPAAQTKPNPTPPGVKAVPNGAEKKTTADKPAWEPGYRNITLEPTELALDTPQRIQLQPQPSSAESPEPAPKLPARNAASEPAEPIKLKATPPDFYLDPAPGPTQASPPQRIYSDPVSPARVDTAAPMADSPYALLGQPGTADVVRQAWRQVLKGELIAAETALRGHLEKSPDDVDARYLLGQLLLKPVIEDPDGRDAVARREAAREQFLKIVARGPHRQSYLTLMALFLDEGNYEDAGRLMAKIVPLYPGDPAVFYAKGQLAEALDNWEEARRAYLQALARQPDQVEFHYRLAQVELKSGRLDAARWELAQTLALSPDDARAWKLLGYIAEKQNQPEQAARFYRQAMQPDALINYGRLLEARNQPEKALDIYAAAAHMAGDDPDILFNLGLIYAQMKRPEQAEAALKRFLEMEKDTQDARVAKARSTLQSLGVKTDRDDSGRPKILPF